MASLKRLKRKLKLQQNRKLDEFIPQKNPAVEAIEGIAFQQLLQLTRRKPKK